MGKDEQAEPRRHEDTKETDVGRGLVPSRPGAEESPLPPGEGQGEGPQHSALSTQHSAMAVWFPAARQVELREEPLPPVGPADVRVRAVLSALSHGTEMLVFRGQVPPELSLDLPTLQGSFRFPIKYGYASVGRVVAAGGEVQSLAVGDLVFVHHPHQTEYVVPASFPVPLPGEIGAEEAVFLANLDTAVNVVLDSGIRLGERVIVFGQGVVGLLLAQLARLAGARSVIAVDPLPLRRDLALAVGADVALSPDDELPARILGLTDGTGADVVLEASGRGAALDQAIGVTAFGGSVVVCSWYGTEPVELRLGGAFHRNRIRLVSSQVSSIDSALQPRWTKSRRLKLALDLLPELRLAPLITHRIPFREAPEAYRLVDQHPERVVQLLLTYDGQDV
jgi:2-desacetyl-2-hydroxyethyl bacteriochlorophyllide A dehydrogenase